MGWKGAKIGKREGCYMDGETNFSLVRMQLLLRHISRIHDKSFHALVAIYCIYLLPSSLYLTTPPRKITNMIIATLLAKPIQCLLQLPQIILILPTRPPRNHNMLRQRLRILRPKELRIVWQADVAEAFDPMRYLLSVG